MAIDAQIPLMYRPPQFENPLDVYGKVLSLRNMQAQQEQQQQLAPIVLQRQKNAADLEQLQLQQQQQQMQQSQNLANAMRDAAAGRGNYAPQQRPAAPPANSPAAAPPSTAPPDALAAAGISNANIAPPAPPPLVATGIADANIAPPEAPPLQAAGISDANIAPPAPPAKATAPAMPGSQPAGRATAQPLDMLGVLDKEFQSGRIGVQYYLNAKKALVADREQLAKMNRDELADRGQQSQQFLKVFDGFLQRPMDGPDGQKENWFPFVQQAYKDGLLNADHYSLILKQHPTLPDPQMLEVMRTGLQGKAGQEAEAIKQQQLSNEKLRGSAEQATIDLNNLKIASQTVPADPAMYDTWYQGLDQRTRARVPADFSPQAVQQVKQMGLTAQQAITLPHTLTTAALTRANLEQKQTQDAANSLYQSKDNDDYQGRLGDLPENIAGKFPESIPADRNTLLKVGMTPAQIATNQRAQDRVAKESVAQHKSDVTNLAQQALDENEAGGGGSIASASVADKLAAIDNTIKNVNNTSFYQDHPIGKNRGEVIQSLQAQKTALLRQQGTQNTVEKGDQLTGIERAKWMVDHPGQPVPTRSQLQNRTQQGGGRGAPPVQAPARTAPPAGAPPAAAPPAPSAPAKPAKTYTEADIRAWAASRGSDPEQAVKAARDRGILPKQ